MILPKGKWNKYTIKENRNLFLFPDEWNKILKIAKPRQALTLNIQAGTGARINEARNIKVSDIFFDRNNLNLRVTKGKKGNKPEPRLIPISDKFAKLLKKYIKQYKLGPDDYFPILKTAGAGYAIKQLTKKIGRKDWNEFSSHNIRKTFECWLIAIGVDGFKVAKHMGHTPSVALKSYISADIFTLEDKRAIRNILGDLYSYREGRY